MADAKAPQKELTKADVAKRVKRITWQKNKNGELVREDVAVTADEVLAFRDYGTHVVVVTTDGQKLTDALAAE
jgi:hypothetical protein